MVDIKELTDELTKLQSQIKTVLRLSNYREYDDLSDIQYSRTPDNLLLVDDAAQAIDSFYKGRPLGSIGHLGAFSFHETKNITAGGEGGLLTINDERFIRRSEILWEKGTNRAEFFRGAVNK